MKENTQEQDFNVDDYDSFYYTSEKQIRKMDDDFIMAKLSEMYPDLNTESDDNILRMVLVVIANDASLMSRMERDYDISPSEVFKTIYRSFEYMMTKTLLTKINCVVKNKRYARKARRVR